MLERYFELELSDFGFSVDDLEVRWNVGFCQGDYVCFTGPLHTDIICKLMMKMHGLDVGPESDRFPLCSDELSDMIKVLTDFGICDLRFTAHSGVGVPYVYVDTSDDFEEVFDYNYQAIVAAYNDTIPWEKNREWQCQWKAFLAWLKDSHEELCSRMLRSAHDILMAGYISEPVVWERKTENYIVRVIEGRKADLSDYLDQLDDEHAKQFYGDLINGEKRYGIFQVKILDSATHRELGSSSHYSFISEAKRRDSCLMQLRRMALHEAVIDTRQLLARHVRVA